MSQFKKHNGSSFMAAVWLLIMLACLWAAERADAHACAESPAIEATRIVYTTEFVVPNEVMYEQCMAAALKGANAVGDLGYTAPAFAACMQDAYRQMEEHFLKQRMRQVKES